MGNKRFFQDNGPHDPQTSQAKPPVFMSNNGPHDPQTSQAKRAVLMSNNGPHASRAVLMFSKKHRMAAYIAAGVLILAGIIVYIAEAAGDIRYREYREVTYNLTRETEEIVKNMDTLFGDRWEDVHFCARELSDEKFRTTAQLMERIGKMQSDLGRKKNSLFLIDTNDYCHTSVNTMFRWVDDSVLNSTYDRVFVSSIPYVGENEEQIVLPVRLPKIITVEGYSYDHLALACSMSSLDEYFDVSGYTETGTITVVHKTGEHIYRQSRKNVLSNVPNVFEYAKQCELIYAFTGNPVSYNLDNDMSGCCVLADDEGGRYYVCYQKMEINDWYTVLWMPEDDAGDQTDSLVLAVKWYVVGAFLMVIALVVVVLFGIFRLMQRQQVRKYESLLSEFEAERSANREKTQFMHVMARNMRKPLNVILGLSTISAGSPEDFGSMQRRNEQVITAGSWLLSMVNNISDISRVQSESIHLSYANFHLSVLFENLLRTVTPHIVSKEQHFFVRVQGVKWEKLNADEPHLRQVFANILSNAVVYTPQGGDIIMELREEEIPGRPGAVRLVYTVEDSGIGIQESVRETMYEVFGSGKGSRMQKWSRMEKDSSTEARSSLGIGLAVAKKIVDLMHGKIECESEVGRGTRFTVRIELFKAKEKEKKEKVLPDVHIILADGDEKFLEGAVEQICAMGAKVDTARTVAEVEGLVNCGLYSMALIGCRLQDGDGFKAIRRIYKYDENFPVILLHSYDVPDIEKKAREAGVAQLLGKFILPSVLYKNIRQVFYGNSGSDVQEAVSLGVKADDIKGTHLLVAEENDVNWEIVHGLLEIYGLTAERAASAQECMELLSSAPGGAYDLVLLNDQMQGMSGQEAAIEIRKSANSYVKNIPIIAMITDEFVDEVAARERAGINGHIAKPVDIGYLLEEIRKVLGKAGS